jgi:hypothetical protein
MSEQATHGSFEILEQIFVHDAVHATRQHVVPMLHEFQVAAVVAREELQVVAELLACGEKLLEVREAASRGLAARIDDLRVRQHQVDQPNVANIIGILSMKKGAPAFELRTARARRREARDRPQLPPGPRHGTLTL